MKNPLIKYTNLIYKIVITQILLTLANLPLSFFVFFIPIKKDNVMLFILLSITLLPSITTIFRLFRTNDSKEIGVNSWKLFVKYYVQDYKQGFVLSLIFVTIFEILVFNYFYLYNIVQLKLISLSFCFLVFYAIMVFICSAIIMGYLKLSISNILKNANYLCLTNFGKVAWCSFVSLFLFLLTKGTNWPILQVIFLGCMSIYLYTRLQKLIVKEVAKYRNEKE